MYLVRRGPGDSLKTLLYDLFVIVNEKSKLVSLQNKSLWNGKYESATGICTIKRKKRIDMEDILRNITNVKKICSDNKVRHDKSPNMTIMSPLL